MRKLPVFFIVIMAAVSVIGCAGKTTTLVMQNPTADEGLRAGDTAKPAEKVIVFPNGTLFGGASKDQASALARIFVDSHNTFLREMGQIKAVGGELMNAQREALKRQESLHRVIQNVDRSAQQLIETTGKALQKSYETSERALKLIEYLSRKQGTGEITLFFPTGSGKLRKGSLEYMRLVNFVDHVVRENRGKKLLFISIGCSSATGQRKYNYRLARDRAEFPVDTIGKYLVNTPHDFFKVYGTGDMYSPENVGAKEHRRYQHARLIAFYETDQVPELPVEPTGDNL